VATGDAAGRLGYSAADLRRIAELSDGPLRAPGDLRRVIDRFDYLHDWRSDYRIRSVKRSLHGRKITCIDAAILSYGLLELLFVDVRRRLLAIHRRDPAGEECGHVVTLYADDTGRIGAFSKSSFNVLGHREARFADDTQVATSYAEAYLTMGFVPLYYGVTTLEAVAGELDWRFSEADLNELSERLKGAYEYAFLLQR
jgi:hypothetical protein